MHTHTYIATSLYIPIITKTNTDNARYWKGYGSLIHCWWVYKLVNYFGNCQFLLKINILLLYDPAFPLLSLLSVGVHQKTHGHKCLYS